MPIKNRCKVHFNRRIFFFPYSFKNSSKNQQHVTLWKLEVRGKTHHLRRHDARQGRCREDSGLGSSSEIGEFIPDYAAMVRKPVNFETSLDVQLAYEEIK